LIPKPPLRCKLERLFFRILTGLALLEMPVETAFFPSIFSDEEKNRMDRRFFLSATTYSG
jgi:hypothetical protein